MLKERTDEIIKDLKNLEDLMVKSVVDADMIKCMDAKSMEVIKTTFKLMDQSCELMAEYATMMDDQNKKIDQILEKLNKWDKV